MKKLLLVSLLVFSATSSFANTGRVLLNASEIEAALLDLPHVVTQIGATALARGKVLLVSQIQVDARATRINTPDLMGCDISGTATVVNRVNTADQMSVPFSIKYMVPCPASLK